MSTSRVLRQLMAVLQPLTGGRSTGSVRFASVAPAYALEKGTYIAPVLVTPGTGSKQLAPGMAFRVSADTTVTDAGVDVPVHSVLGGERYNLPNGTVFRLYRPLEELAPEIVASSALTGASTYEGCAAVKQIVGYEQIGAGQAAKDLMLAKVGDVPAIILVWESRGPTEMAIGPSRSLRPDRWSAHVVVKRLDASELRAADGLEILDAVEALLDRRAHVDGDAFTSKDTEITGGARLSITDASYIYSLQFQTWGGPVRRDDRNFPNWVATKYDVVTTPPRGDLDPSVVTIVEGAVYDQSP